MKDSGKGVEERVIKRILEEGIEQKGRRKEKMKVK